ncbi:MAG: DUF6443 domain-containing protein [Dysgonomonas sp.]
MKTLYIILLFILVGIGAVYSQSIDQNYILNRTYTNEAGTTYLDQVQYFDGLGRPVQTIQKTITPGTDPSARKDLVTLQQYDSFGREFKLWLPAAIANNNGAYADTLSIMNASKTTNTNSGAADQKSYSYPIYEASPLNRVLKQYGPGQDWQNNGKAVATGYLTNTYKASASLTVADSLVCARYLADDTRGSIIVSRSGNYAGRELYVTRLKDEDGNTSYEFKDKLGQVILTRQVNINEHGITELLDTYYTYDSFGNLKMVLPPMASDMVNTDAAQLNANSYVRLNLAYLYLYDNRNRCIGKKLPGCDWMYYVYDKADRVIFTQDGEQYNKSPKEWTFSIPDAFGRVVLTGTCTNSLDYSANPLANIVVKASYNTGRTNLSNSYTVTGVTLSAPRILSVNFYDNYDFRGMTEVPSSGTEYIAESGYGTQYTGGYKDLLTGSLTAQYQSDGTIASTYLYSVMYYDDRGRLIQTKGNNHLTGGVEKEYIAYNFTGQPTQRKHVHSATGKNTQTEVYAYSYDHAGRLLKTTHQLTDGTTVKDQVTLAENDYDELGRLKTNKKGGRAELNTTYSYNVRSWTKKIECPLFNQELYYNESYGGSTKQYNGNISAMSWKQSNESGTLGYAFKYDNLSRLTQAAYLGNGSVYNNGYETAYSYDKHGNIKTLRRNGRTSASTYGTVDNLTMTYDGNQLQKVSDAVPNFAFAESADFKNYGGANSVYTYNKNGAMVSDSHKGITAIQYNSLNLPYELLIKNTEVSGKVYYSYSASGVKLNTRHMKAKNLGYTPVTGTTGDTNLDIIKTTDYVGNMVYEDNTLKRILVDGGYIENNVYYFYVTDHLGNNRVVANQGGASVQRTHYYPFGMAFATGTTQEQGKQPYKFNGKELDQMHGLNLYDYSARYYESAIGRFTTVDPLAEKYYSWSPYAYVMNNPLKYTDPTGMYSTAEFMEDNGLTEDDKVDVYTASTEGAANTGNGGPDDPPGEGTAGSVLKAANTLSYYSLPMVSFADEADRALAKGDYLSWGGNIILGTIDGFVFIMSFGSSSLAKGSAKAVIMGTGKTVAKTLAKEGSSLYRAMSYAEYKSLLMNKGLTYMEGKELFVSTKAAYSSRYLEKSGYDLLVKFDMKPGAFSYFDQIGVLHRTEAARSGWATRGNLLWKPEQGVMNLGIQQNTHIFNPWIQNFKVIKVK